MALKNLDHTPPKPVVHGAPCSMGEVYRRSLDDAEERAELDKLLRSPAVKNYVLERLRTAGYEEVSESALKKHRGGSCRCFNIDRDFCRGCKRHVVDCGCDA